jgi:hypothetical protein
MSQAEAGGEQGQARLGLPSRRSLADSYLKNVALQQQHQQHSYRRRAASAGGEGEKKKKMNKDH